MTNFYNDLQSRRQQLADALRVQRALFAINAERLVQRQRRQTHFWVPFWVLNAIGVAVWVIALRWVF